MTEAKAIGGALAERPLATVAFRFLREPGMR